MNPGEGVEKTECSCIVGGNVNWYSHYRRQFGDSLKKLQIKPHLGILLLGWQIPKTDKTYRTIVTIWPEISHKHILAVWKANNGWPTSLHQGRISFSSKRWISVLDMVE